MLYVLLPAILIVPSLMLMMYIIKHNFNYSIKKSNEVDFNKLLQYKDKILYVDGEKTNSLTALALKIQQHIGELNDNTNLETIEDL